MIMDIVTYAEIHKKDYCKEIRLPKGGTKAKGVRSWDLNSVIPGHYLALLFKSQDLTLTSLTPDPLSRLTPGRPVSGMRGWSSKEAHEVLEKELLLKAIARSGGNLTKAAT